MTVSKVCRRDSPTARTAAASVSHGGREHRPFASPQVERRDQRQPFRARPFAHALGRHAELIAEGSREGFVRAIPDIQRHSQDVGRAVRERLRGPRQPARPQILHDRPAGRTAESAGQVRARYAAGFGYGR